MFMLGIVGFQLSYDKNVVVRGRLRGSGMEWERIWSWKMRVGDFIEFCFDCVIMGKLLRYNGFGFFMFIVRIG